MRITNITAVTTEFWFKSALQFMEPDDRIISDTEFKLCKKATLDLILRELKAGETYVFGEPEYVGKFKPRALDHFKIRQL